MGAGSGRQGTADAGAAATGRGGTATDPAMTLIYRGDYRLRLCRIMRFPQGIRRVVNARGEFIRYDQLHVYECSMERGPVLRSWRSPSLIRSVIGAAALIYRERFFPGWDYRRWQASLQQVRFGIRDAAGD
jgi:hypothetical protein